MSSFCIDQGNTTTKIAFYDGNEMVAHAVLEDATLLNDIAALLAMHAPLNGILSSVRSDFSAMHQLLLQHTDVFILTSDTPLPFEVDYETPHTLGADRKANAAAAISEFGKKDIVIADCGTCITYTIICQGVLKGGAISPGIKMRFSALHHYTGRLPFVQHQSGVPVAIGRSTEGSIRAGVEMAALLEVEKMISHYCSQLAEPIVIFTGGGSSYFVQHLKSPIFARPFLTLSGLHDIFLFNHK